MIIVWTVAYLCCIFFSTDALMEYTNGEFAVTGANATANIFASYPAKHLSVLNGFVDQVTCDSYVIPLNIYNDTPVRYHVKTLVLNLKSIIIFIGIWPFFYMVVWMSVR